MADSLVDFLARTLRPLFIVPARYLAGPKPGKTWHYEAVVVGVALICVALLTTPPLPHSFADFDAVRAFLIIWLSAAAVFVSFLHAQVGTYMAEDMGDMGEPATECYYKLGRYWVWKEIFWFLVFLLSGAYPAIAGNVIFLLFPVWRKIYKGERARLSAQS